MIIWRNFFKASPQPSPWERELSEYLYSLSHGEGWGEALKRKQQRQCKYHHDSHYHL